MLDLQSVPLWVIQYLDDLTPRELLINSPVATLLISVAHHAFLLITQEPRCLRCLGKSEEKERHHRDCQETFAEKQNSPTCQIATRLDLIEAVGKKTAKCRGECTECKYD